MPAIRHPSATKILALLCILIAIAPLASIHRLLTISGDYDNNGSTSVVHLTNDDDDSSATTSSPSSSSAFGTIFQSDHITVEDVVRALFKDTMHQGGVVPDPFGSFLFLGAGNAAPFIRMNQFTLILPWFMSIVMGVIIPSILTVVSYFQRRGGRRRGGSDGGQIITDEDFFARMNRREKRLARLILCLRRFKLVLKETDFVNLDNDHGEVNTAGSKEKCDLVQLPAPGIRCTQCDTDKNCQRNISPVCAVCLGQYESGDIVVWSSNIKCQHVFHEKCIISWLVRKKHQLCPCCRQPFIDPNLDINEVGSYIETEPKD